MPVTETPRNILILARLKLHSGNNTTAVRIRHYFEDTQYSCLSRDTTSFADNDQFLEYLSREEIQAVIGIHALHSGKWLQTCPVPYALVLGGTDINEYIKKTKEMEIMTKTIANAGCVIAFSQVLVKKARKVWPKIAKVKEFMEIPQDWHQLLNKDINLVVIGPIVDDEYGNQFLDVIDGCPGVLYLGAMTMYDTHSLIRDSTALVNCSQSEGMATAILEAMELGTPVLARNIPANAAVIEHKKTGLLFSSPDDFLVKLQELLATKGLQESLSKNGKQQILNRHSCKKERESYLSVTKELVALYDPHWKGPPDKPSQEEAACSSNSSLVSESSPNGIDERGKTNVSTECDEIEEAGVSELTEKKEIHVTSMKNPTGPHGHKVLKRVDSKKKVSLKDTKSEKQSRKSNTSNSTLNVKSRNIHSNATEKKIKSTSDAKVVSIPVAGLDDSRRYSTGSKKSEMTSKKSH